MSDLEGDVTFVALALAYIWLGALLVGYIQLQRLLRELEHELGGEAHPRVEG